jgi:C4-dicarboxylate-specific signal transduction histidine kinase
VIRQIVLALRNFSHFRRSQQRTLQPNEIIDNILLLLAHRLDQKKLVVKEYNNLPPILCYPGQLSQVFTNMPSLMLLMLLTVLKTSDQVITIKTDIVEHSTRRLIAVSIAHNGSRQHPPEMQQRIFDPFCHILNSLKIY